MFGVNPLNIRAIAPFNTENSCRISTAAKGRSGLKYATRYREEGNYDAVMGAGANSGLLVAMRHAEAVRGLPLP